MSQSVYHTHTTEDLTHEGESLFYELVSLQSRLHSVEGRIDDVESSSPDDTEFYSNALSIRRDTDQLIETVNGLVKMVGILAERAGLEVITEDNNTFINEAKQDGKKTNCG